MTTARSCTVCARGFEPRFRFQTQDDQGRVLLFCSQRCQQAWSQGAERTVARCACCGTEFRPEFAYQILVEDSGRRFFCTEPCRARAAELPPIARVVRRIAVFNHKGGTGKTTTAVNVAAGLAEQGRRVLLIDVDPQGSVGVALGIRSPRTLYNVLVLGTDPAEAAVPVSARLDVLTANESLAAAELYLGARPERERVLRERLAAAADYDLVVLDCSPSLSLLNQNALMYADAVLIPVSCDYLALVGVRQVVRTLTQVHEQARHTVQILGVVPTFFDARQKAGREIVETLRSKFGELLYPAVRANTKLAEAPAARQSIFEYAPDSHGALDYRAVVARVLSDTTTVKPDVPHGSRVEVA